MENIEKSKRFRNIFIIYLIVLIAFVAVRICSGYGLFAKIGNEVVIDVVSTAIIQILLMFGVPLILYKIFQKQKFKDIFSNFGFKKLNWKSVLICFGIGVLVFFVNLFVANFFNVLIGFAGYSPEGIGGASSSYDTLPKFLIGVVTVAILPAFCEEFLHRGLVLNGTSDIIGSKAAIVFSSILFGLMHLNIQQVFYAIVLGLLMGFLCKMTRSIWPGIIIHFCNNFINVYLSFAESNGLFGAGFTSMLNSLAEQSIILFILLAVALVTACIFGIIGLCKLLFNQAMRTSYYPMFLQVEKEIRKNDPNLSDEEVFEKLQQIIIPNINSKDDNIGFYLADPVKPSKVDFKYKIPLIACLFLSVLITIFTFIWGCV